MLGALRDDALGSTDDGFVLRLSLPWIRSLPLWSVEGLHVTIDGRTERGLRILLGQRAIAPSDLADEPGWWFVQDRLLLRGEQALAPGDHEVGVVFDLVVPYLQAGPESPLRLPFRFGRTLSLNDSSAVPTVALDVA
ncbi:hypothetical protein [Microbacterium aerolatum]|uniref:Uncharacterized protein n=1 Tax=Microbacterium aerolatum TaxID=153731 RepID=A0A511ANR3_9MICO|nr:hypothetical protein [Microbacterium aerolatum]GEK87407.1 hypothetical protein MAE01_25830 [Microbacterium aerolatum]GGB33312.1 hypothetical protein GCM10007198_24790 [Microbacterium aerolatum]